MKIGGIKMNKEAMLLSDEEKRQIIAQIIWESTKFGTERKEELLEYFTKISLAKTTN